jgi:hypothetical protein
VDGEATAADMAAMRPHLRSCLACRATLREFRAAPARVAAFAPLLVTPSLLRRVGRLFEHLGLQKTAAVVAVAASVAGGGVAVVRGIDHGHKPPPPHHRHHAQPGLQTQPRPRAHIARAPTKHASATHKRRTKATPHGSPTTAAPTPIPTQPTSTTSPRPAPAPVTGAEFGP